MISKIDYMSYVNEFKNNSHVFLVGDLKKSINHDYIKDTRIEFILCRYEKGDHGEPHWHPETDEYEIITSGKIGYQDCMSGNITWYQKGDFSYIPAKKCVKRLVYTKSETIAVKVPSDDKKYICLNFPDSQKCKSLEYK